MPVYVAGTEDDRSNADAAFQLIRFVVVIPFHDNLSLELNT